MIYDFGKLQNLFSISLPALLLAHYRWIGGVGRQGAVFLQSLSSALQNVCNSVACALVKLSTASICCCYLLNILFSENLEFLTLKCASHKRKKVLGSQRWWSKSSMKCLWAVQLRQNQNRWIIYQFVTGHRLVQTPPAPCLSCCLPPFFFPWLCSAQAVNLTANQACPHCGENGEKTPVCNPASRCVLPPL